MKTDKKIVHFTSMPGEIGAELCGNAQCGDEMTGKLEFVTCQNCLVKIEDLAYTAAKPPVRDFGWALRMLKQGNCVARSGWNGKGMRLAMSPGFTALPANLFFAKKNREHAESLGGAATVLPYISMKTATGEILPGWLASQTDMLADDWLLVD